MNSYCSIRIACGDRRIACGDLVNGWTKATLTLALIEKASAFAKALFILSGRQDSNLRPPGPKPGAMTGLRYAPLIGGAKIRVQTFTTKRIIRV